MDQDCVMPRKLFGFRRFYLAVCGVLLCSAVAVPSYAGAPSDQMRSTIEKVLAVLKDPNLKSGAKKNERLDQLRQVVYPKFDFAEMAKRSLGAQWQRRSPEEQREFVRLFTELVENSYFDNIESYDGEKVTIAGEKQDQDFAEVNSKIATKKGEEIAVNYKLHQAGSDWKVYDVVIENISMVNNYRSQFNRVITQSSFNDLLQRMKDKQFQTADKKQKPELVGQKLIQGGAHEKNNLDNPARSISGLWHHCTGRCTGDAASTEPRPGQ